MYLNDPDASGTMALAEPAAEVSAVEATTRPAFIAATTQALASWKARAIALGVADGPKVSTWRVVTLPRFRWYFTGSVVSNFGTWLQNTAQVILAYQLTRSVFWVGVVTSAQFTSPLLLGPWAGIWTHRLGTWRVLITTQCVSLIIAGTLAGLQITVRSRALADFRCHAHRSRFHVRTSGPGGDRPHPGSARTDQEGAGHGLGVLQRWPRPSAGPWRAPPPHWRIRLRLRGECRVVRLLHSGAAVPAPARATSAGQRFACRERHPHRMERPQDHGPAAHGGGGYRRRRPDPDPRPGAGPLPRCLGSLVRHLCRRARRRQRARVVVSPRCSRRRSGGRPWRCASCLSP